MNNGIPETNLPRIVVVGCGFGGLELIKSLRNEAVQIVLLDKNNYHTFQPLLYQVATAGLEADSIAYPIRKIFKNQKNLFFRWCEATEINPEKNQIITTVGVFKYDYLVLATGSETNFFGLKDVEKKAMAMKTITEALNLRSLILQNFEKALIVDELEEQQALMNFVIVGGGPTGVELAGALSELKNHVLPADYPELDFRKMRVVLIESGREILQALSPVNQQRALKYLCDFGVEVWLNTKVTGYDGKNVFTANGKQLLSYNLIWTAGVKGKILSGIPESSLNKNRLLCNEFNQVLGFENIFAIGDVSLQLHDPSYPNGHPQVAPVAIQQAKKLAENILFKINNKPMQPFYYKDKGNMATVGRNKAVAEIGKLKFGGFSGWLIWMLLHLILLIGFRNKIVVLINWVWNYINYDRHIRLIIRPYKREF